MKLTVNIQEELKKSRHSGSQEDLIVKEAKDILKKSEAADLSAYARLGWSTHVTTGIVLSTLYDNMHALDQGRIFSESQIKRICINYRLRCLPSELYCGTIDPAIPGKLRDFESKYSGCCKYFIVAPAENFKLKSKVDPLLFARLSNDKYYLIHKWGDDLSIFRLIRYFYFRSAWHMFLVPFFALLLLAIVASDSPNVGEWVGIVAADAFFSGVGAVIMSDVCSTSDKNAFSNIE